MYLDNNYLNCIDQNVASQILSKHNVLWGFVITHLIAKYSNQNVVKYIDVK